MSDSLGGFDRNGNVVHVHNNVAYLPAFRPSPACPPPTTDMRGTIVRPFAASIAWSDACACAWPAYRHKLMGGVIAHPFRHAGRA